MGLLIKIHPQRHGHRGQTHYKYLAYKIHRFRLQKYYGKTHYAITTCGDFLAQNHHMW